jgi:hypothetical protein
LDKFGAIQEIPDDAGRLAAIAEKQIDALKAKRSSLIIAPTHGECRAIAGAVRKAMKENGLLSDSEYSVTRLQRLNLTDSQQRDVVTYEPGQIVEFHRMAKGADRRGVQEKRFKSGEQWEVLRREEGAVIVGKDGVEKQLPLDQTRKFSVFEREKTMDDMETAIQTRVRIDGADHDRLTGNAIWAKCIHRTTRPVSGRVDPHWHCHALLFNATYDETEGPWKAAQLGNVIVNKGYYQAAFHSRIAENLMEAGHRLRRTERDFEMDVFTHEEISVFCKRTKQIERLERELRTQLETRTGAIVRAPAKGRSRARGLPAIRGRRMPSIRCSVLVTS